MTTTAREEEMERVLMLTGDAAEELEAHYMLYRLREAGYAVDVEATGGTFVEGPAVVDGNMVSATGWPDLAEWSRAFLELLRGEASESGERAFEGVAPL